GAPHVAPLPPTRRRDRRLPARCVPSRLPHVPGARLPLPQSVLLSAARGVGLRGTAEARVRRDRGPGAAAGAALPPAHAPRARRMTRPVATCANCVARVEFRWSSAVY